MKKIISLSLFTFIIINAAFSQQYIVKGSVLNDSTGEPIAAATIHSHNGKTIITNSKGIFKLNTNKEADTLSITAVGYQPLTVFTGTQNEKGLIIRLIPSQFYYRKYRFLLATRRCQKKEQQVHLKR